MTKQELVRDLCSVENRNKSATTRLINEFLEELINTLPIGMKRSRKVIQDCYNK